MHYEIDNTIGFKPINGAIWALAAPSDVITLPRFASNILEIMLSENQKSLSRDYLLDRIWHDNGLSASGNNLNNYMSIVRRSLASIGLKNVIITIPKYGFSFQAQEIVIINDDFPSEVINSHDDNATRKNTTGNVFDQGARDLTLITVARTDSLSKIKWLSVALSLAIVVFTIAYFLLKPSPFIDKSLLEKYKGKYEKCSVYAIWNGTKSFYTKEMMSKDIKSLVENDKLNCSRDSYIYYYRSFPSRADNFSEQRVLITWCLSDKLSNCKNYYMDDTKNV